MQATPAARRLTKRVAKGLTGRVAALTPRQIAIIAVPATVTIVWLIAVLALGEFDRAVDRWESALTMVFGSFLAGSTPAGAGAVAFPVFTKALDIVPEVARTFTLSIQAIGLTVASIIILISRRNIEPRAVAVGVPVGLTGFFAALFLLAEPDQPFWPSTLSPAFIKTTFTILLAAMSLAMFLMLRQPDMGQQRLPHWNRRIVAGLVLAAFLGGAVTAFAGTGVNVLIFLFCVVLAGLHPRCGIPTSILIMAPISVVGLVTLSLLDGQFDVGLAGDQIVTLDGRPFGPVEASRFDLLGLWLAAIPIVVWGAPLGTWVVQRLPEARLVQFVAVLAAFEVVSTAVLVDELHNDAALIAYGIVGLIVALGGITLLRRHRHALLALPPDAE